MSALHVIRASLAANIRTALTGPSGGPPGRRVYIAIGAVAGVVNLTINIIQAGTVTLVDLTCILLALAVLIATPLRPVPGTTAYLLLWLVMLALPDTPRHQYDEELSPASPASTSIGSSSLLSLSSARSL